MEQRNSDAMVASQAHERYFGTESLGGDDEADLNRVRYIIQSRPWGWAGTQAHPEVPTLRVLHSTKPVYIDERCEAFLREWADRISNGYLESVAGNLRLPPGYPRPKHGAVSWPSSARDSSPGDRRDDLMQSFERMADSMPFPSAWQNVGIKPPTSECKKRSVALATDIFLRHGLTPTRIAPSIEEGVMLVYWNRKTDKSLNIEIYNTTELAGLVNEKSDVLRCIDIEPGGEQGAINTLVAKFKE